MQTFLVTYDLAENAKYLDSKRLFKQLLECKQILSVILEKKKAWSNHPAILQWKATPYALYLYTHKIWLECLARKVAVNSKLFEQCTELVDDWLNSTQDLNLPELIKIKPEWWGRDDIISSHRSRLLCKGLIDSYCDAIKTNLKVKSIDKWLKTKLGKTKNQLKYEDIIYLSKICVTFEIGPNYYGKFGWTDNPSNPYIWPVTK
jgi:hypothetical protein